MSIRFFRRIKIAPGLSVNLSKRGASVSVGPRGAKITAGTKGVRGTTGVTGTGLFYTSKIQTSSTSKKLTQHENSQSNEGKGVLDVGFFEKLLAPAHKKAFINGCKEMIKGDDQKALKEFVKDQHADCLFMSGLILLKQENKKDAIKYFELAKNNDQRLGELFNEYNISPTFNLKITEHISTQLTTDKRSLYLLLVELYQELNNVDQALKLLNTLIVDYPNDLITKLSFSEVLLDMGNANSSKKVVDLIGNIENESELHTCLFYYKSDALNKLGLNTAASDLLTQALRKKRDRSVDLLNAIRYLRAIVYEELGKKSQSRKDLEILYSNDPTYEDVAERLKL